MCVLYEAVAGGITIHAQVKRRPPRFEGRRTCFEFECRHQDFLSTDLV